MRKDQRRVEARTEPLLWRMSRSTAAKQGWEKTWYAGTMWLHVEVCVAGGVH